MNTEQVIKSGIIKGDEKTLKKFYRDNITYIKGYVLRNGGTMEDVEDVFQDALVVLYQKLKSGSLEIRVPVKTYFYGICKNTWRSRFRKRQRVLTNETLIINQEKDIDSVTREIELADREHLYRKHFQKLSSDNKNLLLLYFEGKSVREISKMTGYTEGYTRKKKFDVKKQLLTMIEKDPLYNELRVTA
ncbi:RNA polymerase sigma factor [Aquimarina sp. SS2-1]|uniref:RNA polymerase sigma factor n=1 Tax=Aquimarina besae TaxID=3342247 RepID=UPI003671BD27